MNIAFQCDQCGSRYVVKEELAGKVVKCKGCAKGLRIPGTPPAAAPRGESAPSRPAAAPPRAAAPRPAAAPPRATAPRPAAPPPPLDIYGLDDEPAAGRGPAESSSSSFSATEEEAPLPRAGAASRPRTKEEKKAFEKRIKARDRERSSFSQTGAKVSFGAVLTIVLFCMRVYNRSTRPLRGVSRFSATAPVQPVRPAGPITPPAFPEVGPGVVIQAGIRLHEVRIGPDDPAPASPGHRGKLWLYVPDRDHEKKSLPCVVIAGAGTNLITGMDLADGDRAEHVPYVRAGFAVLAYELDGALKDRDDEDALVRSCGAFLAAQAGLVNARNALDFLALQVPEVDPERVYTVGHSSAGTMALLLAEHEPRIKGCVAFAPVVDLGLRYPADALNQLAQVVPGAGDFLTRYNPRMHEDALQCPVLLFHARDDSNVPVSQSLECKDRLEKLGKAVTLEVVPSGDHYQSMISQGIPRAIDWLKGQAGM